MRIAIDVREACRTQRTGKGQWVFGFVSELLKRDINITLLTDSPLPESWREGPQVLHLLPSPLWHVRATRFLKQASDVDIYLSPTSFIVPFLLGRKVSCIPVVHDLIAFRPEPHQLKARLIERLLLPRVLKTAKRVLVVSESTKDDLSSTFKAKNVSVVYAGPLNVDAPKNSPDGKTILCAATLSPRKNQLRLIEAYSQLPDELRNQFTLKLVGGRGWKDASIVSRATNTLGVSWDDYVNASTYENLLCTATIFVYPSLYEGFGMPVLDALQRGIPVLTTDRGSLKEVAGDAAVFVDPESVDSIANGLKNILSDTHLQDSLRSKGPTQARNFSWKKSVDLFTQVLEGLV